MNHSDAERISSYLEKLGIKESKADLPAEALAKAGLIVFVTCGVRQSAEDRVYGQINNIRKKYADKLVVLTGCLAHRKDVQRRLKGKVDLFTSINDFPKEINKLFQNSKFKIQNSSCDKNTKDYLNIKPHYANKHTAYIPIMTGCDNFCAYCVVPYARGREYSRPSEDILKEVKGLVKNGYKEIMLLGQNANSYSSLEINFPKLLQQIENISGKFWLTFLTSHPKDVSDELIETIAKSKKICEYISLPAQSGDNEILRRMNRKYTIEHYKNLIKKIRKAFLRLNLKNFQGLALKIQPAISTDIIVGFPGETKKRFENTAKLLKEIKFDMAYVAQYSPRPETAAWKMKDNVSRSEKERREKVLTKMLEKTALANNKKYVGKIVEVLIDKKSPLVPLFQRGKPGLSPFRKGGVGGGFKYLAHTRTQKKVIFHSTKKIPVGEFVKVKIIKAKPFGLEGKLL